MRQHRQTFWPHEEMIGKNHSSVPLGVTSLPPESEDDIQIAEQVNHEGIYYHLKPFIIVATCLGILPLTVNGCDNRNVAFRWFSLPTFLTLFLMLITSTVGLLIIRFYIITSVPNWGIETIVVRPWKLVFYITVPLILWLSMKFARQFPDLIQKWDSAASVLHKPMYHKGARTQIHIKRSHVIYVTTGILVLAAIEHVMHDLAAGRCSKTPNIGFLKCYYTHGAEYISTVVAFSEPMAITVIVIKKFAILTWNLPYLLFVVISLSLRVNFRVISKHIRSDTAAEQRKCERSAQQWKMMREDHLVLCRLMNDLDRALSPLTLTSFAATIYWDCAQAYHALRPQDTNSLEAGYYWLSFLLLGLRMTIISIAGSLLHEEAYKPWHYLFHCSSNSFCGEVVRFQTHIVGQTLSFTGMKFFIVNRQLLLSIFGVILTYELILLGAESH